MRYWETIDESIREDIKRITMMLLSSKSTIMKEAANIIASIATIEVIQGKWFSIIDSLEDHCIN